MGRNSINVEITNKSIEKHFGEFDKELLLKDESLLELALDVLFAEYNLLKIKKVRINYGFPVLVCEEQDLLVIPMLDNKMCQTLYPDGRFGDIPYEEVVDKYKWSLKIRKHKGKIIQIRLFSSLGLINKDTDEDFSRKPIHFKNRWFYYNLVEEDVSYDG